MLSHVHRGLRGPIRSATLSGAAYAATLAVLVGVSGTDGPAAWDGPWRIATGPLILLAAQILAVAGLLHLFVALRSLARRIEREDQGSADVARVRSPFGLLLVPLSATVASTLAVLAAARAWIGVPGLLLCLIVVPAAACAKLLVPRQSTGRPIRSREHDRARRRTVSRLRGASLATAVAGGAFFVVSGSVIAGALLPLAFLTRVPARPPALAASTLAESGSGGGGGADARRRDDHDPHLAERAGEAIHLLTFAGSSRPPDPLERSPARRLPPLWDGNTPPPLPLPPESWARDLYARIEAGLGSQEERTFLARIADHPVNQAFDALAGAPTADVAGARWQALDGRRLTSFELPVPRSVELWRSVRARIAGAFYVAGTGDPDEARRRLSTVVDLGRLVNQDGPLVSDARVGELIAREGRTALGALSGVTAGAPPLRPEPGQARGPRPDPSTRLAWLREHSALIDRDDVPKGLRWEAFTLVRTFTPCASIRAILLGPSPAPGTPARSLGSEESSTPQDRALAGLLGHGLLGTRTDTHGWGWLPRILGLTLADRAVVSHCAPVAATLFQSG